jgi:hypothetical protein
MLAALKRYAEESDSEAVDYFLSVRDELSAVCGAGLSGRLATSILAYDFSAVLEILKLMSGAAEK